MVALAAPVRTQHIQHATVVSGRSGAPITTSGLSPAVLPNR
jgi:hypothetical protein